MLGLTSNATVGFLLCEHVEQNYYYCDYFFLFVANYPITSFHPWIILHLWIISHLFWIQQMVLEWRKLIFDLGWIGFFFGLFVSLENFKPNLHPAEY